MGSRQKAGTAKTVQLALYQQLMNSAHVTHQESVPLLNASLLYHYTSISEVLHAKTSI